MNKEWVEAIRRSCRASGVRFFFKQWGGVQKRKHGRLLDGRTYDEMPDLSPNRMPTRAERLGLIQAAARLVDSWPRAPLIQIELQPAAAWTP